MVETTTNLYNLTKQGTTVILTPVNGVVKASFIWLHGFGSTPEYKAEKFNTGDDFVFPPGFRIVLPHAPMAGTAEWKEGPAAPWYKDYKNY